MTTIEPDDRGLLLACPKCGQRNRLIYERLGQTFRCGRCNNELRPPGEPIEVKSEAIFRPRGIGKYRQLVSPIVERLTGSSSDLEVLIVFRDGSPLEEPCDEENA